ncbi:MAG: hypothetical protein ACREDK_04525 [Thermoplasmata archaeon]
MMRRRRARWRPWWTTLLVATMGLVALGGVAYYLYVPRTPDTGLPPSGGPPATEMVVIEGSDLTFSYTVVGNGSSGYLTPFPECDDCPISLATGQVWTFSFPLSNSDPHGPHTITGFTIDAPFTLESSAPQVPHTLPSGGSMDVALQLHVPGTPGYYFLEGSVDAS